MSFTQTLGKPYSSVFREIVFADDLNAFRIFSGSAPNHQILKCAESCQKELHTWGRANQVTFDPGKESMHVVSRTEPEGHNFKLLGINFDCSLDMSDAVNDVVIDAGWKLRTLLRTRRFYSDADLVMLYKTHLLAYLEYRTPAIYHARKDVLSRLDNVQTKFIKNATIDEVVALLEFNLAPLSTRRDIAMLGLIHRTVLGLGPPHFKEHFKRVGNSVTRGDARHDRQLVDPRLTCKGHMLVRSALGLVAVYNLLPARVVKAKSVKDFQSQLQSLVASRAMEGCDDWQATLSPRVPLDRHPLK